MERIIIGFQPSIGDMLMLFENTWVQPTFDQLEAILDVIAGSINNTVFSVTIGGYNLNVWVRYDIIHNDWWHITFQSEDMVTANR